MNSPTFDLSKFTQTTQDMFQNLLSHEVQQTDSMSHITKAFFELAKNWMGEPEKLIHMQYELYQSQLELWRVMAEQAMGKTVTPVASPLKGDRRFSHEEWENNVIFNYIKQSYLLTSQWMAKHIDDTQGLDDVQRRKVAFYTQQFLDALSPTNFPMTNPEVIERTIETKGENLIKGLQNLMKDVERGGGQLKISMTDYDAFEVGKNLATTEGSVIYECPLFQLIQYTPKKKDVYEQPLLIVPPWINKYYILDLHPENSFVKYAVEQAEQNTFIISWKNPDETYRDTTFEDYMKAVFEALDVTLEVAGAKNANMVGYCIGGTLLTATLAVMKKKKDTRVSSATMFTTLIDFSDAGELEVFLDEEQVSNLEVGMANKGYLDGKEMAATFCMLRSNDLIWHFVINNYMLGKEPFPFDLLYWNDDPTRMPYKMHSYYLRNMYLENNLVKKNKLTLCGEKIDINQIDLPIYMVTGINDHITPWKSCYSALHQMKSKVRFILSKAGHVAAIVNPMGNPKRKFWVAEDKADTPDAWQKQAKEMPDSWWADWASWVQANAGNKVAAPQTVGSKKHKALQNAPGSYVKENAR